MHPAIGPRRSAWSPRISSFTSPLDNRLNRETYFEHCWPNNATTASFDFIHVVENGNRVFVTYELTATDGKRFRNTEIVAVRNGQVFEAEVYFGWDLPHKAPMGGFARRRRRREVQPHDRADG